MFGLFQGLGEYYYVIFILQGICIFHAIRNNNQSKWIWIIMFLPIIGCAIYAFTEIFQKRQVNSIQAGVVKLVNPGSKIKHLERKFQFTDTFANRVALADAYLEKGLHEKALALYEPALSGLFESNEHVVQQLIEVYFKLNRFDDVIRIAPKISRNINFPKSKSNLLYALALEKSDGIDLAEKEFKAMNHRFSNYEARYNYGQFLIRTNREAEALKLYTTISEEAEHMNRKEKGESKIWIDKVIGSCKKLSA
ncbi:MAG: hypothetical protein JWN56_1994 [Sphingobacteriales bacterium]|nr:hypothetical protein [Sphingobacteriales bacterium]